VRGYLEPGVEPFFHVDSYGYRAGVGRRWTRGQGSRRERCWKLDWVLDLDIRAFSTASHDLLLNAVAAPHRLALVLLYVERWLKAPRQREDGSLVERDRGTPQGGSAISPLLAQTCSCTTRFDAWIAGSIGSSCSRRYATT
jgi:retron-type reverse transcriptase